MTARTHLHFNNSRLIVRCCYLGMFIQALVINLTPLLFIPLKDQLGLTYEQVGRLVLINFLTQMVVDLICSGLVDRINVKPLTIAANLLAGGRAVGLCPGPDLFPNALPGPGVGHSGLFHRLRPAGGFAQPNH